MYVNASNTTRGRAAAAMLYMMMRIRGREARGERGREARGELVLARGEKPR